MHRLALLSAVDQTILDLLALTLPDAQTLVVNSKFENPSQTAGPENLQLSTCDLAAANQVSVPLPQDCLTCSLREILTELAKGRASEEPDGHTLVLLPPATDLAHLGPGLHAAIAALPTVQLCGIGHVLEADSAPTELLQHHPLAEKLAEPISGDERCSAEVHLMNLGYADLVVTIGETGTPGHELIEHLCPFDTQLLNGLDAPIAQTLFAQTHNPDTAIAQIHPATTQAWGGPQEHGTWTLDLHSDRPFHPQRLKDMVGELAGQDLCARGCFWVPTRPGRVCAWEVSGGVVSVGDAGTWEESPQYDAEPFATPHCHLIVTGTGNSQSRAQVEVAFKNILLREDEMVTALSWIGSSDGLEDWLGEY